MAAAFLSHVAPHVQVKSAGSLPAPHLNPTVVAAMAEVGIDIASAAPRVLTTADVVCSDVVITMGCGDACPVFPGKRYLDWAVADPAGQSPEVVREIRDQIEILVKELLPTL